MNLEDKLQLINVQIRNCDRNQSLIKRGIAAAALHIVEGDITKEAVLALLDIEIAYYQKDEPK